MSERKNLRGQGRRKLENPKIPITVFIPSIIFSNKDEGTDAFLLDRDEFKSSVLENINTINKIAGEDNKINRIDKELANSGKVSVTFYVPKSDISEHEKDSDLFAKDKSIFRSKIYKYITKEYL